MKGKKVGKEAEAKELLKKKKVEEEVVAKVADANKKEKPRKEKTTRVKKPCPFPSCQSRVYHIPRHLQDVHGWTKEHSRSALGRFGLRKTYTYSSAPKIVSRKRKISSQSSEEEKEGKKKIKDYHHYRYCPVEGCSSIVKRLPPHLKNVHKILPKSEEYKKVMSKVRGPVADSHRQPCHERPRPTQHSQSIEPQFQLPVASVISSDEGN